MRNRAAQFAPFAAVVGHSQAIGEEARITEGEKEIAGGQMGILNQKILFLQGHLAESPQISATYFIPDSKKDGGAYVHAEGIVRKVDSFLQTIELEDGIIIPMRHLLELDSDLFSGMEDISGL